MWLTDSGSATLDTAIPIQMLRLIQDSEWMVDWDSNSRSSGLCLLAGHCLSYRTLQISVQSLCLYWLTALRETYLKSPKWLLKSLASGHIAQHILNDWCKIGSLLALRYQIHLYAQLFSSIRQCPPHWDFPLSYQPPGPPSVASS